MASCDLCGKEAKFKGIVEGVEMDVCKECTKFGKVLRTPRVFAQKQKQEKKPERPQKEIIELIVEDFGERVKRAREHKSLTQEELAKQLAEKESLLHKIESGRVEPSIHLARRLEKALHIKLVEQHEEIHEEKKAGSGALTIGDILKQKHG
ncbi:TIGR00270 family protein [Candidatus Woesearchaeota archaeon]|nr:TIGR00270 family protein [Candidatus Woesearchaeota archaeon]